MTGKIKLLTAPYKLYNQFMPPVALGIISQHLFDSHIDHDKDDLYVKLYHHQKKGSIKLDLTKDEVEEWDCYITGKDNKDVEKVVSEIASLTNFDVHQILLFSATPPAGEDIPNHILPLALFRFLKKKYNPIIIINNKELGGKEWGIVDEVIQNIPELFDYLKKKLHLNIGLPLNIGTKQNLDGFPIELYRYQGWIVVGYCFYEGCPYNCYFCDRYFMLKHKNKGNVIKLPNTQEIVSEIEDFVKKYKIRNFMFLNTTINPTEKFAKDIAENIIKSKLDIMWCDCANFRGMSCDLLDLLKKSGCIKLVFGLETASKRLQKRINKDIDLEHAEKIIKHCYKIGIWVDVTLLCGLPYETYKDIYKTLLFIKKNYKYLRGINLNRYMTKLNEFYHNAEYHGLITKELNEGYNKWGFDEVNGMNWEEKWKYTEKVYRDIINALDSVRVDYLRPVQHVFRVFSNKVPVSKINSYLESKVFNNDKTKLDLLIEKYKKFI